MVDIERYLRQAHLQWEHGHIEGCIASLRQALSLEPDLAEAHALLSLCLLRKHRIYAAKFEAELALSLQADLELALYSLALVYIALRKIDKAQEAVASLLHRNPVEPMYYRKLAAIHGIKGARKLILPLLEKALELAPDDPETLAEISESYLHHDLAQAEHFAQRALECAPDHVDALVAMGHVKLKQKRYSEAKEHVIWALSNDPESLSALYLLMAIKTKQSWLLGLWWRYYAWTVKVGAAKAVMVLLIAYMLYRVSILVETDLQLDYLVTVTNVIWISLVAYTFIGPALFKRSLMKEMDDVKLDGKF